MKLARGTVENMIGAGSPDIHMFAMLLVGNKETIDRSDFYHDK